MTLVYTFGRTSTEKIKIHDAGELVLIENLRKNHRITVAVDGRERLGLAQAVAGARYQITESLDVVHPCEVNVDDIVEIEPEDGSWSVCGRVTDISMDGGEHREFVLQLDGDEYVVSTRGNTVRIKKYGEQKTDLDSATQQVVTALRHVIAGWNDDHFRSVARELVTDHNVRVAVNDDD